jgi:HSP20 family protein
MLVKRSFPMALRHTAMVPFQSLRQEMDRLFNDWLAEMNEGETGFGPQAFVPRLDVAENADGLTVVAELPGLEMDNVEVDLTPRLLTLTGHKNEVVEEKDAAYFRRERHFGAFTREVALPWEVDPAGVEPKASFKNGVLTVFVPKPVEAPIGHRKIEVAAG